MREKFDQWRARESQRYFRKAADRQTAAADAFQKNAFAAKLQSALDETKNYYDLDGTNDEQHLFDGAVQNVVQITSDKYAWEAARAGLPLSEEELGHLKTSIVEKCMMDRVRHLCAAAAAEDTPLNDVNDDERLKYALDLVSDDKVFSSDEDRLAVKGLVEAALASRERNAANFDKRLDERDAPLLQAVMFGKTPEDRRAAIDQLRANAGEYRLESSRLAQFARVNKLEEDEEARSVDDRY